ncbi:RICIN domain-containing protein [Streptosporangiaceae bacterium NEAU-GS5]|nr:RICIN domain-containing protein [Streptosporangiaceae bacterium NEAU-GS5]
MFGISTKKAAAILAAGALATAGLLATSGAANASAWFTTRFGPSSNPFVFVDVSGGSTGDGAPIIQWSLSGDNQVWTFQSVVGSVYQIVNQHSGKCLTTDGVAGHQLYQWNCHGTNNQLWDTALTLGSWQVYSIRSLSGNGNLYMEVAGGSGSQGAAIDLWTWNGGRNQYFAPRAA